MQYLNEDMCVAYYIGEVKRNGNYYYIWKPVIHLSCAKHRRFGLKVDDIYCCHQEYNQLLQMEPKNSRKNAELLHFAAQTDLDLYLDQVSNPVSFYFKFISTMGNYYYEMTDDSWSTDFWVAATNQKLTDVEIFVGTVKVMEAHQVILRARSPVLNESLNKIGNTAGKSIVTFGAKFDVEVVKHFLNFLYTGCLKTSDRSKQLSKLATMYGVETLKNVCQLLNANSSDVEELTNCLIQL
ncbi:hypothetical protein DAPPUDRAFT_316273 [Daphnia pulex]|uniref:BTB domain-containing protein n=1 Tax=Daphnia pulex TaxID=6669 RepID=E9GCE2_DAPPU|nr:hypothetical protein DAPPUDRAFT_316273 [Daphnia pulex]|eukprot:EFX82532.1 hypothetical protein DAPPUDRAFT_316273 [Daphnia pulex]